jgi:hypothetical protein
MFIDTAYAMSNPKPKDLHAKATECRKLALQTRDPETRERWFKMEQFWLQQIEPDKISGASHPELVKL